jgi:hypothetical protein
MHKHTPVTQVSTPVCHMPAAVQRHQVLTQHAVMHALVRTNPVYIGTWQSSTHTKDEKHGATAKDQQPPAMCRLLPMLGACHFCGGGLVSMLTGTGSDLLVLVSQPPANCCRSFCGSCYWVGLAIRGTFSTTAKGLLHCWLQTAIVCCSCCCCVVRLWK